MKKVLISLSVVALTAAFVSCGGNKKDAVTDSDSVAVEEMVDTAVVDTVVADTAVVEEVTPASADAKKTTKKTTKKETPKVASEQVNKAIDAAAAATKKVAQEGVSDANEKAKSWKDKKKKTEE